MDEWLSNAAKDYALELVRGLYTITARLSIYSGSYPPVTHPDLRRQSLKEGLKGLKHCLNFSLNDYRTYRSGYFNSTHAERFIEDHQNQWCCGNQ